MKRIDCRGLACPQPVLETKKALEEKGREEIIVLVDNPAAKENVRRFAESQGCQVGITEEKGIFTLSIKKSKALEPASPKIIENAKLTTSIFFIDSDKIGQGPEELGKILARSFWQTLAQMEKLPQKIIFINKGVKLACQGSEVLEDLKELAAQGVEILCCGTCLDYLGVKKDLQVGRVSNMYEILSSITTAERVIKV